MALPFPFALPEPHPFQVQFGEAERSWDMLQRLHVYYDLVHTFGREFTNSEYLKDRANISGKGAFSPGISDEQRDNGVTFARSCRLAVDYRTAWCTSILGTGERIVHKDETLVAYSCWLAERCLMHVPANLVGRGLKSLRGSGRDISRAQPALTEVLDTSMSNVSAPASMFRFPTFTGGERFEGWWPRERPETICAHLAQTIDDEKPVHVLASCDYRQYPVAQNGFRRFFVVIIWSRRKLGLPGKYDYGIMMKYELAAEDCQLYQSLYRMNIACLSNEIRRLINEDNRVVYVYHHSGDAGDWYAKSDMHPFKVQMQLSYLTFFSDWYSTSYSDWFREWQKCDLDMLRFIMRDYV